MASKLSVETALATMEIIADATSVDFQALGINDQDLKLVMGKQIWHASALPRVMRVLNALIFGTCTQMGLPKIVVPSEYVAAVIAVFVGGANMQGACIWLSQERQTGVSALELAARRSEPTRLEPTNADQLFALVCKLLVHDKRAQVRDQFLKRMGAAIAKATQKDAA